MLSVTLTLASKNGRIRCEASRDGQPVLRETFSLDSARTRDAVASKLGTDAPSFLRHASGVTADTPVSFDVEEPNAPPPLGETLRVCVRDRMQTMDAATCEVGDPTEVIRAALSLKTDLPNPVVEWDDDTVACFLDVDYHDIPTEHRPGDARMAFIVASIQPQPVLWFRSLNGGLHALYVRNNGIPANVLAAVAGFSYRAIDATAEYDLIPRSRLATNDIHLTSPTTDLGPVRRYLRGSVDENEVERYVEGLGVERGRAYEHTHCPVEPWSDSRGEPVYFGDTAVVCKRCEAKGVTFGSRRPGIFPYALLCGSHDITDVSRLVENVTHWTQAKVVLESRTRLRGRHARLAYEGMLRLRHGDDDRVNSAFSVGEHLIRGNGRWVTPDRYETLSNIRQTLASLPSVRLSNGKPSAERLDMFDQTVDLGKYGYSSITPLRGMRIFGEFLGNEGAGMSLVIPPPNLVEPGNESKLPRYVRPHRRLNTEEAWSRIDAVFPNINRNYLTLLIAARGVSEGETGMPANIICVGPAASGKSSTPHVAAAICGDNCTEVQWTKDDARFRQSYSAASSAGSLVVINELFKDARRSRVVGRAALDNFLNLTPGSLSHELYVGPVPLGRLPVTVVTDTSIPPDVRSDAQIGRRFVYVRLFERLAWEDSIVRSGIGVPSNFRAYDVSYAEAGNAIVSDVIDRFFSERARPLVDIARELGFDTIEHSDLIVDDPDSLPVLFESVCKAPEVTGDAHFKGRGWKRIGMEDQTPIAEAWNVVADGLTSFDSFATSRKVQETDWSTVVDVPKGTEVDVVRRGRSIVVRFRYGSPHGANGYFVNDELLTCEGQRREKNA